MGVLQKYGVEILAAIATALVIAALLVRAPFPRSAPAGPVSDQPLEGSTEYSIDTARLNRKTIVLRWHPQPLISPAIDEPLIFDGWAVDEERRLPARAILAVVDGLQSFSTTPSIQRNDVAAKFDVPAFAMSGFEVTIPACALAVGPHRVVFRFVASDGRGFFRSRDYVDIDVRPGARGSCGSPLIRSR